MIWVLTHKFLSNSAAGILSKAIFFRGHLRQWEDPLIISIVSWSVRRVFQAFQLSWIFWAKAWASCSKNVSVSQWHLPPSAGIISGRNKECLSLQICSYWSRFLVARCWSADPGVMWLIRGVEWVLITAISLYSLRTSPSFHLISKSALLALVSSGEGSSGVFPSGLSSCWGWPPRVG